MYLAAISVGALIIVELIKSSLYSSISIQTKSVKERKDPAGQLQSCSASFLLKKQDYNGFFTVFLKFGGMALFRRFRCNMWYFEYIFSQFRHFSF